jgi:hypothetical protein
MARTEIGSAPEGPAGAARGSKPKGRAPTKDRGRLLVLGGLLVIAAAIAAWVYASAPDRTKVPSTTQQRADEISQAIRDASAKQAPRPTAPAAPQVQGRRGGPVRGR